jgi:hypothetical protein
MMTPLFIESVGVCAGGMASWNDLRAQLRGEIPFTPAPPPRLAASALPSTERRRANETSRWALQAAGEAVAGLDPQAIGALATVFTSADGDGAVLAQVLRDLAADKVALSPTTFHNSVFNAPGGYWSIAAHVPAASTTLCAGDGSFAAGLLESGALASATREPLLLVAYDHPFPADSPVATRTHAAFACALRASPQRRDGALGCIGHMVLRDGPPSPLPPPLADHFSGNASAAALALLRVIACAEDASVSLPYDEGRCLEVAWTPLG